MFVPFSTEVKTAIDLATNLKFHATIAIYALILTSVICTLLLAIPVLAIIGLLITVNPDLARKREALVTPAVKRLLLPVRDWRSLLVRTVENAGKAEKAEGVPESEKKDPPEKTALLDELRL